MRELAADPERWAVSARCERGYTKQLPDLAVWLKRSDPPVALVAESGGRREDRQKMILVAWRDAIVAGRYAGVRYDCANQSVARWITRLAKKVWLTAPAFVAAVQPNAEEIAALSSAADTGDAVPDSKPQPSPEAEPRDLPVHITPLRPAPLRAPVPIDRDRPAPPPETSEAAAERKRLYREIFEPAEPSSRRRWRR